MDQESEELFGALLSQPIPYRKSNLWGFCDVWGNLLIEPQYDEADFFICVDYYNPEFRAIVRKNDRFHLIDSENRILHSSDEEISDWDSLTGLTFHLLRNNGKQGIFFKNSVLLPPEYDEIKMDEDAFILYKGDKLGLYDFSGKEIIPIQFDSISYQDDDEQTIVRQWKAIRGNSVSYFSEPRSTAEISSDEVLDEVLAQGMVSFVKFEDELNYLRAENKIGIHILKSGNRIPAEYDDIKPVDLSNWDGESMVHSAEAGKRLFTVKQDDQYGLINEQNQLLIPLEMKTIETFNRNIFYFTKDNKKGCYLVKQNRMIAPEYETIAWAHTIEVNNDEEFKILEVQYNGKKGFIGENNMKYFED